MLLSPNEYTTQQFSKEPGHGSMFPLVTKAMSQPQAVTYLILAKSTNVFTTKGKTANISQHIITVITNT